ncbi:valine--tRNA ligase [Alicyclobacillus tolerans]|uniref:Valine--tRNA ligase n=1 Tax=Alicyclobacillus tolerans TaxID=90970 RepID=A0A1M6XJH8_9BACL|nr:valine--tRNA ligase [Alicyclobacillus montanus]SHL06142.1 valyl-tRNA synthetase [Alicyclobacillus montanus]
MQNSSSTEKFPQEMNKHFQPQEVEREIYAEWEKSGTFQADSSSPYPAFSMVIPPPNVTGVLHLGHAWNHTLQDILARYHRMRGKDVLWLPGTDHAGIATQTRVEKMLMQENGQSRHDIGRTAFVEKVWEWKDKYGSAITEQIRRLGDSVDWSRERFTMDEGLSQAVRTVFVELYQKGLIYRGNRIINWCSRCGTALSDIEVEHIELPGKLYHIRYPLKDGSGEVVIATTRPETFFADVAVAVHPNDERYSSLIGKTVILPLSGREIPILADPIVDREYGTGCVKITPAHDPNDFEVGLRHQLPQLQCIGSDGKLNELAMEFAGRNALEARQDVVDVLRKQGYLLHVTDIVHAVGHCSRCSTVVDPLLSLQWFVRMQNLADPALQFVHRGELQFVPARFEKVFVHWLENVKDWCISRQLWWGHRIPAWYCDDCGGTTVQLEDATCCGHCKSTHIHQDEDVLDTWFSSALWPFSTLGWPDTDTPDYQKYYPTSVLVTAYDIIFFWVARMVFMGLEFTGQMPFQTVVLHGLIRDSEGRKMSKSLGNGVDPIEIIEQYGADTLRFCLATGTSPGNDQRFSMEKIEGSRNFMNKLWNAARFVRMNLSDSFQARTIEWDKLDIADRWILHRLAKANKSAQRLLEEFEFGEAARVLYDFAWDDFCDWYIEMAKISLYGESIVDKERVQTVLYEVLQQLLQMLHPFIPFITEEIWSYLPQRNGQLLVASDWPQIQQAWIDDTCDTLMGSIQEAIRSVRNIRSERNIPPSREISLLIRPLSVEAMERFQQGQYYIQKLCHASQLENKMDIEPPSQAIALAVSGAEIFIPLAGLIDLAAEKNRLEQEKRRWQQEIERIDKKFSNPNFLARAPQEVVEAEKIKREDYEARLSAVEERLRAVAAMEQ